MRMYCKGWQSCCNANVRTISKRLLQLTSDIEIFPFLYRYCIGMAKFIHTFCITNVSVNSHANILCTPNFADYTILKLNEHEIFYFHHHFFYCLIFFFGGLFTRVLGDARDE
jgi:hypothetical protein